MPTNSFYSSRNSEPLWMRAQCLHHALSSFLTPIPCVNHFRLRKPSTCRRVKAIGHPTNSLLDLEALCNWGNEEIGLSRFTHFFEGRAYTQTHTHFLSQSLSRSLSLLHTHAFVQARLFTNREYLLAQPQLSLNGATYPGPIFIG